LQVLSVLCKGLDEGLIRLLCDPAKELWKLFEGFLHGGSKNILVNMFGELAPTLSMFRAFDIGII
jgi:hypothetical protein